MKSDMTIRISVMLAVPDAQAASQWYQAALGASVLWDLGSVVGLDVHGSAFFLGEPARNGWETPSRLGSTTTRVQVFCDDPDSFIAQAIEAGADRGGHQIQNHEMPWGVHRQGGFTDPYGHLWFVGDRSPLMAHAL